MSTSKPKRKARKSTNSQLLALVERWRRRARLARSINNPNCASAFEVCADELFDVLKTKGRTP